MVELLRNKNLTTRFRILVEIADNGPNVQQRDIARKLDITPQAVSEYIARLIEDGLVISEGRSRYRMTGEAVDWIIKGLKEINDFSLLIQKAIKNYSVCAAIAESDLSQGQKVGLIMKDGLLFATPVTRTGATGIAGSDAAAGCDVSVTDIEGIVTFNPGQVAILKIPGIQKGGSGQVDMEKLKKALVDRKPVGAIGIEAIVSLSKIGIEPLYIYGVPEAAVTAARSGLYPAVVCIDDEALGLVGRLVSERVDYEMSDLTR